MYNHTLMTALHTERTPQLPRLLAVPFARLPDRLHSQLLARVLGDALRAPLQDGELDFLQGRTLSVKVGDAGIKFGLTLENGRLRAAGAADEADLLIEGTVYDFLQLLGRQVDPDTLVFQRRLVMQGSTELGLQVKNFLDGLDIESISLYRHIQPLLLKLLPVYRNLFG